ncbi:MAG: hypothetical protein ABI693_03815 [Bryobacteraceae bacterium]
MSLLALSELRFELRLYPGTVILVCHDRFFLEALGPAATLLNLARGKTGQIAATFASFTECLKHPDFGAPIDHDSGNKSLRRRR